MDWEIILKSLGNIQSRFRRNNIPSKEEVEASDEASKRNLDTGVSSLREQYNSSLKGKDIANAVITQMITGRRSMVGNDRDDSLKIIGERLKQWESLLGSNSNELYEKTMAGIKYSDLVEVGNKTNKEWTIETLNALYQKMITEPSVELLYAIHYFIDTTTNGQWRIAGGWKNKMGRKSIENPDPEFLKNVFNLRGERDVKGGIDKKVFDFFTDEYKYTTDGIKNIEINESPMRSKKTGIDKRTKTVGAEVVMEEKKSLELLVPQDINLKISRLTETDFTDLINNLNKTNSGSKLTSVLKGKGITILYNLMFNPTPLNVLVREIDIRRKGHSGKQRRKDYLHDWAISYINRKLTMAESNNEDGITINSKVMYPSSKIKEYKGDVKGKNAAPRKVRKHFDNKRQTIDWIKSKVKEEDPTWEKRYQEDIRKRGQIEENWKKLSQEEKDAMTPAEQKEFLTIGESDTTGTGFANISYSIKGESDIETFVNMFNLGNKRYIKNMISLLFDYYMSSDKNEAADKASELLTISPSFTQYIPTGRLFADSTKTSFVDSMRAILTFVKLLHGRDSLTNYNEVLGAQIIDTFLDNLDKLFVKVAKEEDYELEEKDEIWDIIVDEDLVTEEMKTNMFGVKNDFLKLYDDLNNLVADLEDKIISDLISIINDIALDTTDKNASTGLSVDRNSAGIRKYLISKKLITIPTPPNRKKFKNVKHILAEGTQTQDLDAEIIYYPYEKNTAKDSEGVLIDKNKPYKTTLRDILGDEN